MKLKDYPFQINCTVRWGDMDANGHVNNTVYYRYFENARVEIFNELIREREHTQIGPVLAYMNCHFVKPISFPDKVIVGTRVKSLGRTSIVLEHVIHSEQVEIAAHGESVIVIYDFESKRKIKLPFELKNKLMRGV
jgi:acyl-CoA thioester hydrolase